MPATTSDAERDQHRAREEHPAAAAVDAVDPRADAGNDLLARLEQALQPRLAAPRRRRRDAREEAALAEVGQQPRQPRRPGRAEALLGQRDEVDQRARAVELLEQLDVVVAERAGTCRARGRAAPSAARPRRVEPLERVARAHARAHPELRRDARRRGRHQHATRSPARRSSPASASRGARPRSSASPSRIFAPSRSGTGPVTRTPSRYVPWRSRRPRAPARRRCRAIRACTRETDGSPSTSVEPGARPDRHLVHQRHARGVASTSSSGAPAPPAACRSCRSSSRRARAGGGSWGTARCYSARQRLERRVVARTRSASPASAGRRAGRARAARCPGPRTWRRLDDHQRRGCRRARSPCTRRCPSASRSRRRSRRAWSSYSSERPRPGWRTTASCLPSGEIAASSTPFVRGVGVGHEVALAPVARVGRERRLVGLDLPAHDAELARACGFLTPTPRIERPSVAQWIARADRERPARRGTATSIAVALDDAEAEVGVGRRVA